MHNVSDEEPIERLVKGDPIILKVLYTKLLPKVIAYVRRNKGTVYDGEEIFQDALFQLITRAKIGEIHIKSSFEAYVYTVCKNLWLRELNNRKKQVRNDNLFELNSEAEKTIANIIHQERWDLFEEKLQLLTENCKALLKDFFNKLPYKEIVSKFQYSCENVAFQRVFKCKKKLADLIKSDIKYKSLIS